MTRAVITCPGLLVFEFKDEFSCSGKIVPRETGFCASNPVASTSAPSSNIAFMWFYLRRPLD